RGEGEDDGEGERLGWEEGQQAPVVWRDYLSVRGYESELKNCRDHFQWLKGEELEDWHDGIIRSQILVKLDQALKEARKELNTYEKPNRQEIEWLRQQERIVEKMTGIANMNSEDTVIEKREGGRYGRTWDFDVVWTGRYGEQYLFCGVSKVVIMSATLRPKTMALLGVGKDEYEFRE